MLGGASEASGLARMGSPVTGAGLKLALPLFWTLPWTSMTAALTWALPLADRAEEELEST